MIYFSIDYHCAEFLVFLCHFPSRPFEKTNLDTDVPLTYNVLLLQRACARCPTPGVSVQTRLPVVLGSHWPLYPPTSPSLRMGQGQPGSAKHSSAGSRWRGWRLKRGHNAPFCAFPPLFCHLGRIVRALRSADVALKVFMFFCCSSAADVTWLPQPRCSCRSGCGQGAGPGWAAILHHFPSLTFGTEDLAALALRSTLQFQPAQPSLCVKGRVEDKVPPR